MLAAMVAGTVAVIAGVPRREPAPPGRAHPSVGARERPWLTREATAQIVTVDGSLGPLFAGVELGGPPPTPDVRARINAFARANQVEIELDVADDTLVAVRFAVSFGGCCGYEAADVLALRLGRPDTGGAACTQAGPIAGSTTGRWRTTTAPSSPRMSTSIAWSRAGSPP